MKRKILGAVFISIAAILWGLDGTILTPRLQGLQLDNIVFILHFIPFVMMSLFFYKEFGKLKEVSYKDILLFVFIALSGGIFGTVCIVKALFLVNFQKLSVVVLLQKLQPLFGILSAYFLLGERIRKNFLTWTIVALIGSYLLSFGLNNPLVIVGSNYLLACSYSIIAAVCFGFATTLGKMALQKHNFKTVTFFRYGFTAILMLLFIVSFSEFSVLNASTFQWKIIFLISLTTGSGAIMLYYLGLTRVRAVVSTICELFFPLSAIFFDYWINDSILSPIQWIGAIILLLSIVRIALFKQQEPSTE